MNKKIWWVLAPMGLLALAKLSNAPKNWEETSPNHEELALRTRIYPASLDSTFKAANQAIDEMKTYGSSWELTVPVDLNKIGSSRRFTSAEVPVFLFTDDLIVTLEAHEVETRVNVRSQSRVGQGDFGENRRHILQFLAALDAEMQKTAP